MMVDQPKLSFECPKDVYRSLSILGGTVMAHRVLRMFENGSLIIPEDGNVEPTLRMMRENDHLLRMENKLFGDFMVLGLEYITTMIIAKPISDSGMPYANVIEALCYIPFAADTISRLFTDRNVYSHLRNLYRHLTGR